MAGALERERRAAQSPGQERSGACLRLHLLNGFRLTVNEREVYVHAGVQRLVAFLALSNRPMLRPYIAGSLWLDLPEPRSAASLRSMLWRLRRSQCEAIISRGDALVLAPDMIIDLHETSSWAHLLVAGEAPFDDIAVDLDALSSDLLPDWYEDWVILERERFRQLRLHALEVACERLTATGRFAEAILAGLSAVAAEPLRESAQRALIKAHIAEGNRNEAIRQYTSYRQLLRKDLGLEPTEDIEQLVNQLSGPSPRSLKTLFK